jgi:hypothetical protein
MCWVLIGGLTLGLGTQGLGRSSRGDRFGKSLQKETKKVGMGSYLHMQPFILSLVSFYGLTSNFSYPITYFEVIFLLTPPFDAFPTCR